MGLDIRDYENWLLTQDENKKTREEIVSIMTNAIAWELEKEDQPEDGELMTTQENIERYKRAAERAYRQGIEGKD